MFNFLSFLMPLLHSIRLNTLYIFLLVLLLIEFLCHLFHSEAALAVLGA